MEVSDNQKTMLFKDISRDTETIYRLGSHEKVVFFLSNRSGDIAFELTGEGAEAHVFAFFNASHEEHHTLNISQKHLAPHTISRVMVKSLLDDTAKLHYRGVISIAKNAPLSDASQENRNLLLSPLAKVISEPALEIINNDVRCHHAATTSPLNTELLFSLAARGLTQKQAETLLVSGFFRSSLHILQELIPSQDSEKMLTLLLDKA